MANFGFTDLVVVNPYEPIWKETRSAPGAEHLVLKAKKFSTIAQATQGFRIVLGTSSFHQRPAEQAVVDLPAWCHLLQELPAGRIAVLFGSERSGLSNEELAACRAVIRIPTEAQTPSMNSAQAVAVTLYELQRHPLPTPPPRRGREFDMEPLIRSWIDLAAAANYPPGYAPAARAGRIRQAAMGIEASPKGNNFCLASPAGSARNFRNSYG